MPQKQPISKYRRVRNTNEQKKADNVLLLRASPRAFIYAAYAAKMLYDKPDQHIQLNGTGTATYKVIQTVEFLRRRMKGLHVAYDITTTVFKDVFEPTEKGLDTVTVEKNVATIEATLSLQGGDVTKMRGYMPPLDENKLLDENKFKEEIEEHQKRQKEREERGENADGERKPRNKPRRGRNNRRRKDQDRKEDADDKQEDNKEDGDGENRKPRRGRKNNRNKPRGNRKSTYEEERDTDKGQRNRDDNEDGEERKNKRQNRRGRRGGNFRGGYRQRD